MTTTLNNPATSKSTEGDFVVVDIRKEGKQLVAESVIVTLRRSER